VTRSQQVSIPPSDQFDRSLNLKQLGMFCCLLLTTPGTVGAQVSSLPRIALVGDPEPPPYAAQVAKLLRGKAVVLTPHTSDFVAWAREHRPDVLHLDWGKALHDDHVAQLPRHTSLILAARKPIPTRDGLIPVHVLSAVGDDEQRQAEAVADSVLRQLAIRKSKPTAPAKADVDAYQKEQANLDALVPAAFKKLPLGEFRLPESAAAWKKQRPDVQKKVRQSLGDLPPRPSPLRVRLVSRELRRSYTLERLAIDNGMDGSISALLLVPDELKKPAPAILWLHSSTPDSNQLLTPHTNGGEEPLGEVLVKRGYVVLAPDAAWYGDRAGAGPAGSAESGFTQQQSLMKLNLWLGRTLWGVFVRDDQIALDYLCTRPEVDAKRIGATGMSMGSTRAWWLAAVDDRVAATVAVACLTRYQNLIAHGQLKQHGVYYFVFGLLKHFDTEGVLALIAPRPFLALTGELDAGSPADGVRVLESKVGQVYRALGERERFQSVLYPGVGHTYTAQMREEMVRWFDRWLRGG
jgi:dienelactone hydrolase